MVLELIDWVIIGLFFVISIGIGIFVSKKAGKNTSEFFCLGVLCMVVVGSIYGGHNLFC